MQKRLVLQVLSIVLAQPLSLASWGTFRTFRNMTVLDDVVSSSSTVTKRCECHQRCWQYDTCTGVTVRSSSYREPHTCLFTEQIPTLNSYEGFITGFPGAATFLKKRPCLGNFVDVEGVGCLYLSTTAEAYDDAKVSCSPGSGLFAADSAVTFNAMKEYLMARHPDIGSNYWVGIERNLDNVTWRWRDGGSIDQITPSSYWANHEPDSDTRCARMAHLESKQSYFSLADSFCSVIFPFICVQL